MTTSGSYLRDILKELNAPANIELISYNKIEFATHGKRNFIVLIDEIDNYLAGLGIAGYTMSIDK